MWSSITSSTHSAKPSNSSQCCSDTGWMFSISLIQGVYMAPICTSYAVAVPINSIGLRNGLCRNAVCNSDLQLNT